MYTDSGPGGVDGRSDHPGHARHGPAGYDDIVNARNTARMFALIASPAAPRQERLEDASVALGVAPAHGLTFDEARRPEDPNRMSQLFRVHPEPAAEASVLELTLPDQLDDSDFDRLNESLLGQINESSRNWIIDLSRVDYMGSAMLGMMVNLRQQVKNAHGRLVLCGMSPRLTDIFRTCCMERLFTITRTRADALRMVK